MENQENNKIAIIGQRDLIAGFGVLGLKILAVETKDDCAKIAEKIKEHNNYSIIFILEKWYPYFSELIETYGEAVTSAFMTIPDHLGSSGMGLANIKKIVERAVGSDVIE